MLSIGDLPASRLTPAEARRMTGQPGLAPEPRAERAAEPPPAGRDIPLAPKERSAIDAVLEVLDLPADEGTRFADAVYRSVWHIRRRGEPAFLVTISIPGGGTVATAYDRTQLIEGLQSSNPAAMGSITTNGGQTYSLRDLVLEALGRADAGPAARDAAADRAGALVAALLLGGEDQAELARRLDPQDGIASLVRRLPAGDKGGESVVAVTMLGGNGQPGLDLMI
jgi:hypothetical protein